MDSVVQQNASNAEESASAAEQMNAQANQMKEYLNELVVLVRRNKENSRGGNGAGSENTRKLKQKFSDDEPSLLALTAAPSGDRLNPLDRKTGESQ